jgi:hypothetical protein
VVQHASGSVIIPHDPDFTAMTVYDGKDLSGSSIPLKCHVEYDHAKLARLQGAPASFLLKRGYMATIAEKENGTGTSRNYVAQDHDLVINTLPAGLDKGLSFIRIFPLRWTSKKGVAGGIWQNLNVGWFYEFMGEADAAGLRVDFVAVHYYRAVANPKDAKGAANQFYQFLKGIHDRVKRPLWITE